MSKHGEYLGQEVVDAFSEQTQVEWAKDWMGMYAQIDGTHHKAWCLDQVQQILNGTKVIVSEAKWADGHKEYRYNLDEPSQEYLDWVKEYEGEDEDGDKEYEWDTGIAP